MKTKYLAMAISVALVLGLVACGGQQAQEPQEPQELGQSVQQSEPVISEPVTAPQPLEEKQEVDTMAAPVEESQGMEDGSATAEGADGEEPTALDDVELFTDCNEEVYATGTVNIRESWSAESEKLGSLNTGESVTRTGNAIAGTEAEGWSRVQLSDGTIAFISSNYLSTTKPQQTQQQSGGTQTSKPATGTTTMTPQTTTPQQSGGGESDAEIEARKQAFLNGMTQMFEENGYNADGKDHDWTEEEKQALLNSVQMGG